jgi:hypothetical protein
MVGWDGFKAMVSLLRFGAGALEPVVSRGVLIFTDESAGECCGYACLWPYLTQLANWGSAWIWLLSLRIPTGSW